MELETLETEDEGTEYKVEIDERGRAGIGGWGEVEEHVGGRGVKCNVCS